MRYFLYVFYPFQSIPTPSLSVDSLGANSSSQLLYISWQKKARGSNTCQWRCQPRMNFVQQNDKMTHISTYETLELVNVVERAFFGFSRSRVLLVMTSSVLFIQLSLIAMPRFISLLYTRGHVSIKLY